MFPPPSVLSRGYRRPDVEVPRSRVDDEPGPGALPVPDEHGSVAGRAHAIAAGSEDVRRERRRPVARAVPRGVRAGEGQPGTVAGDLDMHVEGQREVVGHHVHRVLDAVRVVVMCDPVHDRRRAPCISPVRAAVTITVSGTIDVDGTAIASPAYTAS